MPVETADELQSNPSLSPERAHSSSEIKNWLRQELAKLSPRTAEMFTLRYIEGLDNPEIAATDEHISGGGCGHSSSHSRASEEEPSWL